jgi:TIR domain-containing protein
VRVFIAHSNKDNRVAGELAEKLRAQDLEVFLDDDSLPPAADYDGRIRAAIEACDVFVFLVSAASTTPGTYALTELGIARRRWPNPAGRVLPVLVGPVDVRSLPPYLTQGVTVFSPMGNAAAESAYEVMRLVRERGFGWRRWKLPLGGAVITAVAIVVIQLSSRLRTPTNPPAPEPPPRMPVVSPLPATDSPVQTPPSAAPSPPPSAPRASSTSVPNPTRAFPLPARIAKAEWTRIGADAFTERSAWFQGDTKDDLSDVEMKLTDGKYRFTLDLQAGRQRFIDAPYRPVVDFYAAVDFRLVASTAPGPVISLLFGRVANRHHGLVVTKGPEGTSFRVLRFDGSEHASLVPWAPASIRLSEVNRLGVLVENNRMQFFINSRLVAEHRDPSFTGGKVALAVEGNGRGSVVVDFDNFELRVPPE